MTVGAAVTLDAHGTNVGEQDDRALPDLLIQAGRRKLLASNQVCGAQDIQALARHLADNTNAETGARERLTVHQVVGQTQLAADRAHLILEEGAQGLDQLEGHVLRQAAHVVVALNVGRALAAAGLDDVGVQGALDEELHLAAGSANLFDDLLLGGLEGADELAADDLTLRLGLGDAGQGRQEALGLVTRDDADTHAARIVVLHLLALARAQQAVIDEEAGQLVADGLVHERRGHGGVHAAGQRADDLRIADLLADLLDLLVHDGTGGPRGCDARTLVEEVLQGVLAELGVAHLGVPLQAVEATLARLEGRDGGLGGGGGDGESLGRALDGVTVAHPHDLVVGGAAEQAGVTDHGSLGVPVLAGARATHRATQSMGHGLEAVADAQDGHTGLENRGIDGGRTLLVHGGRAAGQDDGGGLLGEHVRHAHSVGDDLGVDVSLTYAARDQLGVLSAEVDDEDGMHVRSVHPANGTRAHPAPSRTIAHVTAHLSADTGSAPPPHEGRG